MSEPVVYTVGLLNRAVRRLLLDSFSTVRVAGELSGLMRAASGHWYFTLKDETARVRCAMFRNSNRLLRFEPRDNMQVEVRATPDLYTARGEFQLIVSAMAEVGAGDLHARFERLKRKLHAEGLFDEARKRPLPAMPRALGVVASTKGAALRDILSTLAARCPAIEVHVYPVPAQGEAAPAAICEMLAFANQRAECDALILARGGGSIEDLQAFNEESVARAIAASRLPIVTGIGHEIDHTIADFVADLRAPTPTGAAQHASPDAAELLARLAEARARLERAASARRERAHGALARCEERLARCDPRRVVGQFAQRLDEAAARLAGAAALALGARRERLGRIEARLAAASPRSALAEASGALARLDAAMRGAWQRAHAARRHRLESAAKVLDSLSHQRTLARGYAIVTDEQRRIVRSAKRLRAGQALTVQVSDGDFAATVARRKPQAD